MSGINFFEVFTKATTLPSPFRYQCRLACGPNADPHDAETLSVGGVCQSQLIQIPTGCGKTAAVVLAWLWNRVLQPNVDARSRWPRRLVFCLPMRTLVEQTAENVRDWLQNLDGLEWDGRSDHEGKIGLNILMGGEERTNWDLYPERDAILVGTQDMLLSRALNRGYGMSRYRWPMHFGLLNNDALWVLDETQLMGVGVETSAQLDGFRHDGKIPTFGVCPTWWMSATLDDTRVATINHPKPVGGWHIEILSEEEENSGPPHKLIAASKKLSRAPIRLSSATKGGYAKQLASIVKDRHKPGTLTLVVMNRVSRAREIFERLTAGKNPLYAPEKVALMHSRFRPIDRERHTRLLFGDGDRIVVATQAVEAGVDVSARLLITELAPWSSLIQRMGRCNRRAEIPDAEVLWLEIEPDLQGELLLPYSREELDQARTAIALLTDASPRALREIKVEPTVVVRPVIRRRDLVDLFDTTPDICGQDLDVSRFIRDGNDNDVQFFWRNIDGHGPAEKEPLPQMHELCRVSIGDAMKFLGKNVRQAWGWNPLEKKWETAAKPRPGGVYLLATTSGGYNDDLGWTGDPKDEPTPHSSSNAGDAESYDSEPDSFSGSWQTISEHTQLVIQQTIKLASLLAIDEAFATALRSSALWHDIGKAHSEFQKMLRDGDAAREDQLWAKSANKAGRSERHGFRHELASALAWLLRAPADSAERDLVAYLIAAHHGKVRLSIRSLPDEAGNPQNPDALFARGIWQWDALPPVPLGDFTTPEVSLDLSFMRMGEGPNGPSWLARTVALRDRLGPFYLALLETVLRAADARASRERTLTASND